MGIPRRWKVLERLRYECVLLLYPSLYVRTKCIQNRNLVIESILDTYISGGGCMCSN